jgi:TRAP-type mannitol/chloroaromatic compound transport system permease small subunit
MSFQVERTAFFFLWFVFQSTGVDIETILAAFEAGEASETTAGAFETTTCTIVSFKRKLIKKIE